MCKLTAHEIFIYSSEGKKQKDNETNQSIHDCFTKVLPCKIGSISSTHICRAPALGSLAAIKKIK